MKSFWTSQAARGGRTRPRSANESSDSILPFSEKFVFPFVGVQRNFSLLDFLSMNLKQMEVSGPVDGRPSVCTGADLKTSSRRLEKMGGETTKKNAKSGAKSVQPFELEPVPLAPKIARLWAG